MSEDEQNKVTGYDTELLAKELTELCPQDPGGLLRALLWLYHHQELGAYLCGLGPKDQGKRRKLLRQLQEEGPSAYLALAAYSLLLKSENSKGENKR